MRLFSLWGKKPYFSLYEVLGFIPGNIEIYREALSHASVNVNREISKRTNNERLEFLGDAILEAIISDILYKQYPNEREGFLTNLRAAIVQRKSLNQIAIAMNLEKVLSVGCKVSLESSHIGGNALEALIGAIYIDKGYDACHKFVKEKILSPFIDLERLANTEENYKSRLMEWCQKNKVTINYVLIENPLENNTYKKFKFEVYIEGIVCGSGKGISKKEAQQRSSQKAYNLITNDVYFRNRIFEARNCTNSEENRVTSHPNSDIELQNSKKEN